MRKKFFLAICGISVIGLAFVNNQACLGEDKAETVISAGKHEFPQGIIVKKGEALIVNPGAHLKMGKNTRIIVEGKIIAKGTKDRPIIFSGSDGYWRGIKITGQEKIPASDSFWQWLKEGDEQKEHFFLSKIQQGNIFKYCKFENISTEEQKLRCTNKRIGALEIYNSSVQVSNSEFNDILHIAGVLTQESYVLVANNSFITNFIHKSVNITRNCIAVIYQNEIIQQRVKNQTCADGIWVIGSTVLVMSNNLEGIGDDAVDIKGSRSIIINNKIDTVWDEGIDLEGGINLVIRNSINNSNESGIMITQSKNTALVGNTIRRSNIDGGLTLRNGAVVTATKTTIQDSNTGVLFKQIIPLGISEADFIKTKEQLLVTPPEEIAPGMCDSLTPADLINKLESAYTKEGNYYYYKFSTFDGLVEEVFKTIKFEPEAVNTDRIKTLPLYAKQENRLYLVDSRLENNRKDFLIFNNFLLNINNTEFTDEESKTQIQKKCTADFKPQFIDDLGVSSVISNSNRILQVLNRQVLNINEE
ncbi:MAG: right-handed parallel beta-helix repeat-containing protein [Candidatus Omnitrophota bacterium]